MTISTNKILKKFYYDPELGLMSPQKLYNKIHDDYPNITLKNIQEFISNQSTNQININKK
jgi:hypothetical protein